MLNVERTINKLLGLINPTTDDIVECFDTTSQDVIVSSRNEMNTYNGEDGVHSAYEDDVTSPKICFVIQNGVITIAWEA
jgi:hypothetical protein